MPRLTPDEQAALSYLRSPVAIRERCQQLFDLATTDQLTHFAYEPSQLDAAADYVVSITRQAYPALDIPLHSRWRHFQAGGVDRLQKLTDQLTGLSPDERARCQFELVITSVLLDAGAGADWAYLEAESETIYRRSEGLAVASYHLFMDGQLSSQATQPYQADAAGLQQMTKACLAAAFQVTPDNPLVGLDGRVALLRQLGQVVASTPEVFGQRGPRLGHLYDYLCDRATNGVLLARDILDVVLDSLSAIWPERLTLGGVNLGDVWHHPQVVGPGLMDGCIPFHKLSQWLTYSLIEPLQLAGQSVVELDALTGLAEYRNGGLFIDSGVLIPKHQSVRRQAHPPGSDLVIEWRALTVVLLDRIALAVRERLQVTAEALPLASVLEGGTWRAGREIAATQREGGGPPIQIASDGTVF